jgi:hypothetical protein
MMSGVSLETCWAFNNFGIINSITRCILLAFLLSGISDMPYWLCFSFMWPVSQDCLEFNHILYINSGPGSVVGIATGYRLDGSGIESRCGRGFPHLSRQALRPTQASCMTGTGPFPGVKSGRDVTLSPHPLLVQWSWKSRAITLLPLWAVRPVQRLSACTGVHFTYT